MQLTASAFWVNPNTETTAADCSGRKQRASGSNHHGQRQQWHTSMAAAVGYVEKVKQENVTHLNNKVTVTRMCVAFLHNVH